uniref:Uncharacterized protein n=1 Tax=Leersia perrieri TaxID=77586 RepID=A0A0D9WEU8_9ORYZ
MCIQDCVAPPCSLAFVDGFLLAAFRIDKNQPIFGSAIYFRAPRMSDLRGEKEAELVVCANDAGVVYDINTSEKIMCIQDCVAPPSGLAFVDVFLLSSSRMDKNQPIFGSAIYFWAPSKVCFL